MNTGEVPGTLIRLLKFSHVLMLLALLAGCSSSGGSTAPELRESSGTAVLAGTHFQIEQTVVYEPVTGEFIITPDRSSMTHVDLAWLWKYYPEMLWIQQLDHDPDLQLLTLAIQFTNPLNVTFGDVRAIFTPESDLKPMGFDGWTTRGGSDIKSPDPYIAFGRNMPDGRLSKDETDTREVVFSYEGAIDEVRFSLILDAVINANTAEPYAFGEPQLTGRFFHIQISDWQDDITTAFLQSTPDMASVPLRMAPFGDNGEWGVSIMDIPDGDYRLRVTAESPEDPGEDEEIAVGVHWVDLHWPSEGPLVPLPRGVGVYGYGFRDPDTNLPPLNVPEAMEKFKEKMGGKWLFIQYGYVCNSGYLSRYTWTPFYVQAMHAAAPDVPIHLTLDKMRFPPQDQDPCLHPPERYTQAFWDHLLESIRGQILENPQFDGISGIHFDIEIWPIQYSEEELALIYLRYADFLGRLHMEPDLRGLNVSLYEFITRPHLTPEDLPYLCTTDAFMPECYYTGFTWSWDPAENITPFFHLNKLLGEYSFLSREYGRPYYPILGTFSGWYDGNNDTLGLITPCPQKSQRMIDDTCFGNSDFDTINEFQIVMDRDVHGMYVEKVILQLETGEDIFPANGAAVYRLGDGDPANVGDDIVMCRTAYAFARAANIVDSWANSFTPGSTVFRYESFQSWKAAAYVEPLKRGEIAGVSGRLRFSDGLSIREHPEIWDSLQVDLIDPLTPEITESQMYRTSIDIVGVEDGSYIFPDLPGTLVTIQASADGWVSDPVTIDLNGFFEYRPDIDLMMHPL